MIKNIKSTSIICRNNTILSNKIDGEVIMMNIEEGNYYSLNRMGSTIWEIIEKPTRFETLIEKLMIEFEVDAYTCETELLLFISSLSEKKAITITDNE